MIFEWHQQLSDDGWKADKDRFWDSTPCFYDLAMIKTVILVHRNDGTKNGEFGEVYYWKYGRHDLPEYLNNANVEIRRYKLHHSMNALLWYDHGDRYMGDVNH